MAKKKYIKTPGMMWDLFSQYKEQVKDNPIRIAEQRKSTINILKGYTGGIPEAIVELPAQRPLTMEGFQNFLDDQNVITDVTDYFENKENRYAEYVRICARVKRVIRQDQIEGGMAGIYNPSITQRLNGLTDKSQVQVSTDNFNITLDLDPSKSNDKDRL